MIPLDRHEKWSVSLDEYARGYLNEMEYRKYCSIPDPDKLSQLKAILEKPISRFTSVNEVFFRARWAEVLSAAQPGASLTLLEVASGDADMIPQMLARAYPHSRYITANMNRILTERLKKKLEDLPLEIKIIEEDASEVGQHMPADSVDFIAFQHAVNDVIQSILCDQEEVDTIHADWMEILPKMIRILQREIAQNTLEGHAKPAFLSLLQKLSKVLKKGGVIAMNHYMFQLDLDWGYPADLWENLIPVTRKWIRELPGCKEVFFEGFDPQWWMFYRKD